MKPGLFLFPADILHILAHAPQKEAIRRDRQNHPTPGQPLEVPPFETWNAKPYNVAIRNEGGIGLDDVLGIDLGTTHTVAACFLQDRPELIALPDGSRLLPSVVAVSPQGQTLVGHPAKAQLVTHPGETVASIKRLMGRRYTEITQELTHLNQPVRPSAQGGVVVQVAGRWVTPEEISALILLHIREASELHLEHPITRAVITVPAYFDDAQRQATRLAGEMAGLDVLQILNEPTAAAVAYSCQNPVHGNILVYDFGGGTIDISLLKVSDKEITVLSTAGDTHLGGDDLDLILMDYLLAELSRVHPDYDFAGDLMCRQRLRDAAESAKRELSAQQSAEINLPFLANIKPSPLHFATRILRSTFENLIRHRIEETVELCQKTLAHARLEAKEIQQVILVGGSTRIPLVSEVLSDFFPIKPSRDINPDEVVALGAAIQAASLTGRKKDLHLFDITPLTLGLRTFGGAFTPLIPANAPVPASKTMIFSNAEDHQNEVDIQIYQGERALAEDNKLLGTFTLSGLNPAPRGHNRIEVTFSVNTDGILSVKARDMTSDVAAEMSVQQMGLLSPQEIQRLKKQAEKYRREDAEKKQLIHARNTLVRIRYALRERLDAHNLEAYLQEELSAYVTEIDELLRKDTPEDIRKGAELFTTRMDRLTRKLERSAPQPQNAAANSLQTRDIFMDEAGDFLSLR